MDIRTSRYARTTALVTLLVAGATPAQEPPPTSSYTAIALAPYTPPHKPSSLPQVHNPLATAVTPVGADSRFSARIYNRLEYRGFTVHLNPTLAANKSRRQTVIDNLGHEIDAILATFPPSIHVLARTVPIWLEEGDYRQFAPKYEIKSDGWYYPLGPDLTVSHQSNSRAGGIYLLVDLRLVAPHYETNVRQMPGWLVHEFAHALHDRVIGFHDAGTLASYGQAVDRKLYDRVTMRCLDSAGKSVESIGMAYGRTNHLEYFAESYVSYFNLNATFYPHTRDQLQTHDAQSFRLMEVFWSDRPIVFKNSCSSDLAIECRTRTGFPFKLAQVSARTTKMASPPEVATMIARMPDGTAMPLPHSDNPICEIRPPADSGNRISAQAISRTVSILDE